MARTWFRSPFGCPTTTPPRRSCRPNRVPILEQLECRELLSNVVTTPFDNQQALREVQGAESSRRAGDWVFLALRPRTRGETGFTGHPGHRAFPQIMDRIGFRAGQYRPIRPIISLRLAGLGIGN